MSSSDDGRDTTTLSVSREVLVTVGAKVVQGVLGFVGVVLFARILRSDGLGRYRTVLAAAFVVVQLSDGISLAIKKRVAEVDVDPPEFLTFGLLAHGGVTAVTAAVVVLARPVTVPYFGSLALAGGVAIATGALGFFTLLSQFQAGIGYPGRASWYDSVRSVLTLVAQVGLLVLGYRAFGVVVGLALATVATGLLVWLSVRTPLTVPTARTARRTVAFARHSVPTNLLSNFYTSADPLLIRAFAGPGAVGFYTVASRLAMPGAMFASSINNALTVKSSGVDSAGGEVRNDLINSVSYAGLISIPILFGALAIPDALMTSEIFGGSYSDASGLVLVGMALFQVSNTYRQPFEAVVNGVDRPEVVFRVNLLVTAVFLPAAVVLGQRHGLLGVVAGTVVAEVVRVLTYQYVVARLLGGVVVPRPVLKQLLSGVVMFGAVEGLTRIVSPDRWPALVAVVAAGAAVYFLTLTLVSRHFRNTVTGTLGEVV